MKKALRELAAAINRADPAAAFSFQAMGWRSYRIWRQAENDHAINLQKF